MILLMHSILLEYSSMQNIIIIVSFIVTYLLSVSCLFFFLFCVLSLTTFWG